MTSGVCAGALVLYVMLLMTAGSVTGSPGVTIPTDTVAKYGDTVEMIFVMSPLPEGAIKLNFESSRLKIKRELASIDIHTKKNEEDVRSYVFPLYKERLTVTIDRVNKWQNFIIMANLTNTTLEDAGTYSCILEAPNEAAKNIRKFTVTVTADIEATPVIEDYFGGSVTLPCSFTGDNWMHTYWLKYTAERLEEVNRNTVTLLLGQPNPDRDHLENEDYTLLTKRTESLYRWRYTAKFTYSHGTYHHNMTIEDLREADSGIFICLFANASGDSGQWIATQLILDTLDPLHPQYPADPYPTTWDDYEKSDRIELYIGIGVGSLVLVLILISVITFTCRRRRGSKNSNTSTQELDISSITNSAYDGPYAGTSSHVYFSIGQKQEENLAYGLHRYLHQNRNQAGQELPYERSNRSDRSIHTYSRSVDSMYTLPTGDPRGSITRNATGSTSLGDHSRESYKKNIEIQRWRQDSGYYGLSHYDRLRGRPNEHGRNGSMSSASGYATPYVEISG